MKIRSILLLSLMVISLASCGQINENKGTLTSQEAVQSTPRVIGFKEFKDEMQQPDVQIIDVRTDQEVNEGMLPGAVQMDVADWDEFVERTHELDPDKPVLVYCRSGARSNRAAKYLTQNGFSEVYDLKDGILGWKKNNGEIIKQAR